MLLPVKKGPTLAKRGTAVEPYYEVLTFEPAADATNASDQYLVAMDYGHEVFRVRDNGKFHDQRGYLIYDKKTIPYIILSVFREPCALSLKDRPEKQRPLRPDGKRDCGI